MQELKDINWNQLYYFYETARKLSIKQSAGYLGISKSNLSEQIKRLEKSIGKPLFLRRGRSLALTELGSDAFSYTQDIFETGRRLLDMLSTDSLGGYPVRIGVQDTLAELKTLNFIEQYADLYSKFGTVHTQRDGQSKRLLDNLSRAKLDWIITIEKPLAKNIDHALVNTFTLRFGISKEVYQRFLNKEDLFKAFPLALSSWDKKLSQLLLDYLSGHNIYPQEIISSDHRELCLSMASRGRCIVPLDQESLKESPYLDKIEVFDLGLPLEVNLYCAWRKTSRKLLAIQKLSQLLTLPGKPLDYNDPELMIRIANLPHKDLKK